MKIIILLFISIFLFFCENKENKAEIKTVYNIEEYTELWIKDKNIDKKIKIIDTFCINQTKKANEDIKNGKLTYFMSKYECEFIGMKKLLGKQNINVEEYLPHLSGTLGGFKRNCYQIKMWSEINKRFGQKYIDSLMALAEKDFVINNPDSLYYKDGKDVRSKYKKK
jgi:hypothetical protein